MGDLKLYRIKDWDKHYENNKSRERERCSFCCVPNKQDGLGYGLLLNEPNGESLYGAFVAVVLVASKQKVRKGYLTANGLPAECPLSARQLSIKCRFKEDTIQRMLDVCCGEVGWIEELTEKCPPSAHEVPAECPPSALEEKRREGNGREGALAEIPNWEEFWGYCQIHGGPPEWYAKDKFLAAGSDNWKGKSNWTVYADRCRGWWQSDGSPLHPPKPKNQTQSKDEVKEWTDSNGVRRRRYPEGNP